MVLRNISLRNWVPYLAGGVSLMIASVGTYFFVKYRTHLEVVEFVCGMVEERFYEDSRTLRNWAQSCREEVSQVGYLEGRDSVLSRLQVRLYQLGVSHLVINSPAEDRRLWEGEARENGVQVRLIGEKYVVTKVIPGGPAEQAGIRPGDTVEEWAGNAISGEWQLNHQSGEFVLQRNNQAFAVVLDPAEIKVDSKPYLSSLNREVGLLTISSFRGGYFEKDSWMEVVGHLAQYKRIVIDLRENSGGSFVAILRALSPFFCEPTRVARLLQPRKGPAEEIDLIDNLDEEDQYQLLQSSGRVNLVTYKNYGCFRGLVTVLTNFQTASVAEIFADAFRQRPNSRIWGEPTAGDVLLAVWYFIPSLPHGYTLAIPEAVVLTDDNHNLEAAGVWPDRFLQYQLAEALKGQDSWLMEAMKL